MCYSVCWMVHLKDPLLVIEKNSPCSGCSEFPLSGVTESLLGGVKGGADLHLGGGGKRTASQ